MSVVIGKDLTDLWDGESVGTWVGFSKTVSTYTGFQREGTYNLGVSVSNTTESAYKTFTSFSMVNQAIYVWFFVAGQMDVKSSGGIRIVLGDGTNRRAYYVGGSDSLNFQSGIWACLMVDASNPPTGYNQELGSSAPNFAAITQVGVGGKTLSKALGGADNFFWDIARYGYGITIKGGTSGAKGTFAEAAADDDSRASGKAYGILRTIQPGVFGAQGRIRLADGTTLDSYFKTEDELVVYEDNGAGDTLYKMEVIGNATGTNSVEFGNIVGSGDTAKGSNGTTIQSAGPKVTLDFDDSNMDTLNIYGSKFFKILGGITLSTDSTDDFIGNVVDQCTQAFVNQAIIRNCTFSGYAGTLAAILWNATINIKNCQFNNNTDITNTPSGVQNPGLSDSPVTYDNLTFAGNDADTLNSGNAGTFTAGTFVISDGYKILTVGTTDFTLIGSPDNNIGTKFVATGVGAGTGTATEVLVVNKSNGSNPAISRNTGTNADTLFVGSVSIQIECIDRNNNAVGNTRCGIYQISDDKELMNEDSNGGTGIASESYGGATPIDIYWRVRESPAGGDRYVAKSGLGAITSNGFSVTVTMEPEPVS